MASLKMIYMKSENIILEKDDGDTARDLKKGSEKWANCCRVNIKYVETIRKLNPYQSKFIKLLIAAYRSLMHWFNNYIPMPPPPHTPDPSAFNPQPALQEQNRRNVIKGTTVDLWGARKNTGPPRSCPPSICRNFCVALVHCPLNVCSNTYVRVQRF